MLDLLRTLLTWIANGGLIVLFVMVDNVAVLAAVPPVLWLAWTAPAEMRQRLAVVGVLAAVACVVLAPPLPIIIAIMSLAGAFAVHREQFSRDQLLARVTASLGVYTLAALGAALFSQYLSTLDEASWGGLFAIGNAAHTVAQGRDYLNTIAAIFLIGVLPVVYLGLLFQSLFLHAPPKAAPADYLARIRSRSRRPSP
ncbi:MAG: hypothetical protein HYZ49_05760 [Chloroflexi bacterium]|nr:hypothetical protein [Chloroflexota bacterium]